MKKHQTKNLFRRHSFSDRRNCCERGRLVLNSRVTSARYCCCYNRIYFSVPFCLLPFDRFFLQSDFQLFLRTNVIIHSLPRELKSIRLQNYDSGVCTFIDFKLWFTVLNDRYREISLTMSGSVECWCYHWHVPIWINHNQMHSKHDENASHALV